ncbi:SDR family NAD(P)-dependent oxidoreductase [Pseudalkalibacillus decolorationis]|uniref:SDR family NAD(P)-dependent oxidoreductase n=1 Tax=Pseudalkalibacillus decolorationis TaxID=163879 RepID=UPI002147250F|nr:SDR family NAD(P)-dependent oxidoreductase [Pseudalkalibacillus decolorationis]
MRFKDKVVLVTGAARGIGQEIATKFAVEGASVALNDINSSLLKDTIIHSGEIGNRLLAVPADVSNEAAVAEMIRIVEEEIGPVDIPSK